LLNSSKKIYLFLLAAVFTALAFSVSFAETRIPGYTDRYYFVHPKSIWEDGKRMAIVADELNPLRVGQEMHVMRGDDIVGIMYVTNIGRMYVYGYFFSPVRGFKLISKDNVAIPQPESLPARLPNKSQAQILFHSMAPDGRIWAVIDRGIKDSIDYGQEAPALLDGRRIGIFKVFFAGKKLSYGLLDREAIISVNKIDECTIDFSMSIDDVINTKVGK
jgi:hypothetical protein